MAKRLTIKEVKNALFKVHGDTITIVDETYIASYKKATFVHSIYGPWKSVVRSILNGSTHKLAADEELKIISKNRRVPLDEIKKKLFEMHGDSIHILEDTYVGFKSKASFIHKDGSKWEAIVYNVLKGASHTRYYKKLLTKAEMEEKIKKIHGDDIKIFWDTFVNTHTKAKFTHKKYGEYWAFPFAVFAGQGPKAGWLDRTKKTNLERFGVEFSSQNREVALKMSKGANSAISLSHWKTGEQLICIASYELRTVNYLNSNKINYLWQPQVFNMPNGKTYRPDLFLINENKWIEIKGYFRKDALEKWNWFQSKYPNSELWDKNKLKSLGIL
jgi:hypothetical protein